MYGISQSDTKIMKDLVRELSEFNSYVKAGLSPFGREYMQGNYFYAFSPANSSDKEQYHRSIRLLSTINDVLDENCINIKSEGYTFLKDAICIITDRRCLDVCMVKEVYPYIAEKYKGKSVSKVEHSIRNALASAYCSVRDASRSLWVVITFRLLIADSVLAWTMLIIASLPDWNTLISSAS